MRALGAVVLAAMAAACARDPQPPPRTVVVHERAAPRTVVVHERAAPPAVRHNVRASQEWERLGERWVDGRVDRDTIDVGRSEGRFRSLMLGIEGSAVELFDVRVVFADGSDFSPRTRLIFAEGSRTREIDLPGGNRAIRRIEFRYGNLPGGGRARVELWGR